MAFRGPARGLDGDYVTFLGGTETFGRFILTPFPELLEGQIGVDCVNLGVSNAGVDLYLDDPGLMPVLRGARAAVIQVTGAQNLSNRYYRVHPRRNDRFVTATADLVTLFPEVDFAEVHFTRHLLATLAQVSQRRAEIVAEHLRTVWIDRMERLIRTMAVPTVLVAFGRTALPDRAGIAEQTGQLLDRAMLRAISGRAVATIDDAPSDQARAEGTLDMVFEPGDRSAAAQLPGPLAHDELAESIDPHLRRILRQRRGLPNGSQG